MCVSVPSWHDRLEKKHSERQKGRQTSSQAVGAFSSPACEPPVEEVNNNAFNCDQSQLGRDATSPFSPPHVPALQSPPNQEWNWAWC